MLWDAITQPCAMSRDVNHGSGEAIAAIGADFLLPK
jgi:hypothetical protein